MKIKQVIAYFHNPKGTKPIKIHKYHINRGTARLNPWFDYHKRLHQTPKKGKLGSEKLKIIEFEVEVERLIE